jgi:hypothetical protein
MGGRPGPVSLTTPPIRLFRFNPHGIAHGIFREGSAPVRAEVHSVCLILPFVSIAAPAGLMQYYVYGINGRFTFPPA